MFAVTATGVEKFTCCHPEAVSFAKVAVASELTGAAPQVAYMGAGVCSSFVEADSSDKAIQVNPEFDPEFDCVRIVNRRVCWCG